MYFLLYGVTILEADTACILGTLSLLFLTLKHIYDKFK